MAPECILAIDLGTSGPKVALVTTEGEVLASEVESTAESPVITERHSNPGEDFQIGGVQALTGRFEVHHLADRAVIEVAGAETEHQRSGGRGEGKGGDVRLDEALLVV